MAAAPPIAPCLDMDVADFMSCSNADHAVSMYEERLAVIDEKMAMLQRHREELRRSVATLRTQAGADQFAEVLKRAKGV